MNRAICILIIYYMQITGVVVLVRLSIILFEVFPEKSGFVNSCHTIS